MSEWKKAKRLPLIFRYREPRSPSERIITETGVGIWVQHKTHYIMMGLHGEVYPISKELFFKTYKEIKT